MKQADDNNTGELDLGEVPRRPGRPSTGSAMSNAERQRAYRQRQKEQRNENVPVGVKSDSGKVLIEVCEFELLNIIYALDDAKRSILKDPKVRMRLCEFVDRLRPVYRTCFTLYGRDEQLPAMAGRSVEVPDDDRSILLHQFRMAEERAEKYRIEIEGLRDQLRKLEAKRNGKGAKS